MAISGSLNFLTASEVGSWVVSGYRYSVRNDALAASSQFIPNDFVGLNTNIYEPISGTISTPDKGYPGFNNQGAASPTTYLQAVNTLGFPSQVLVNNLKYNYRGGMVDQILITGDAGEAAILNTLLHHRNGPYQHPTWKQIRGGEHPVARALRLNNTMSIDASQPKKTIPIYDFEKYYPAPPPELRSRLIISSSAVKPLAPDLRHYYEPSVVSHYKPLLYNVGDILVKQSLFNEMSYFSNVELNERLNLSAGDIESTGSRQNKENLLRTIVAARNLGAEKFVFSQTIFPRAFNTYRKFSVRKPFYEDSSDRGYGSKNIKSPEKFGLGTYNAQQYRTFWKDSQPPGRVSASVPGSAGRFSGTTTLASRLREVGYAVNSQVVTQSMTINQLTSGVLVGGGAGNTKGMRVTGTIRGLGIMTQHANYANHDHIINYTVNGIVTNQINSLTASLLDEYKNTTGSGVVQLDAYQPYPLTLLSTWPLDVRDDIYEKPNYLTSSRGGQGLMIGMTPHSLSSSATNQGFAGSEHLYHLSESYASKITGTMNLITRSAGELVYNTKPTILFKALNSFVPTTKIRGATTFSDQSSTALGYCPDKYTISFPNPDINRTGSMTIYGYQESTASLQFLRHVYPYNTPFWATHKIIGRNPMYDSYQAFIGRELEYVAKEYSIIPEFRLSDGDHYSYYTDLINNYEKASRLVFYRKRDTKTGKTRILRAVNADISDYFDNKEIFKYHKLDFLKIEGATGTTASGPQRGAESIRDQEVSDRKYKWTPEAELHPGAATLLYRSTSAPGVRYTNKFKDPSKRRHTYAKDSVALEFYKRYSHADNLLEFSKILNERVFGPGDLIPAKIKFRCKGIKKLLPYNGFYPVTRTVQLGSYLKNAFGTDEMLGSDYGFPLEDKLQTFLEPLMAPGVLFNSIKSGIAVDYPVLKSDADPEMGYSKAISGFLLYNGAWGPGNDNVGSELTGTFGYGALSAQGARICFPGIYKTHLTQVSGGYGHYFDFDSLRSTEKIKRFFEKGTSRYSNRVYMFNDYSGDPFRTPYRPPQGLKVHHFGTNIHFYINNTARGITLQGSQQNLYQDAMHNFLAETMEFFLEDQTPGVKLPILFSNPQAADVTADLNTTYYADVTLEMGKDQILCEGPRDSGIHISASSLNTWNVTSSLRGYLYGPPTEIVKEHEKPGAIVSLTRTNEIENYSIHHEDVESYMRYNIQDPAYQNCTPPYFYGKSSLMLSFKPQVGTNDIKSVFHKCIARSGSFFKHQYDLENRLAITIPTTGSMSKVSNNRMKIDSSVDIFNQPVSIRILGQEGSEKNIWYINPKWVCPVLDFSSSYAAVEETYYPEALGSPGITSPYAADTTLQMSTQRKFTLVENTYHGESTGRSIWGGYGTDPYDASAMQRIYRQENLNPDKMNKGIYLKIEESWSEKLSTRSNATSTNRISALSSQDSIVEERYSGIGENILTGSLIKDLGFFEEQAVEIGKIAKHKIISEAIVVIPYFERPITIRPRLNTFSYGGEIYETREIIPGKHFLPVNKGVFENILSILLSREFYDSDEKQFEDIWGNSDETYNAALGTDCGRMISSLLGLAGERIGNGYQLPPEFDFVHNASIDPFQMIILPFRHRLMKQDLINIYQGIMPDISIRMQKQLSKTAVRPNSDVISNADIYPMGTFLNADGEKIETNLSALKLESFLSPHVFTNAMVNTLSDSKVDGSMPDWTVKDFYKNMNFMVFKVKQRGVKDYDIYKKRQIAKAIKTRFIDSDNNRAVLEMPREFEETIKNRFTKEIYGTNWPYDYFSLIEAIKLDIEIEM